MVSFSPFPADPRPRRAAQALVNEGMSVDLICVVGESKVARRREVVDGIDVLRIPFVNRRGSKFAYAYRYTAFILAASAILTLRSLTRRYDLVYVHNMPDVLVSSALIPKALGAKVILDLHDPMPELMTTIYGLHPDSSSVRLLRRLEKWSIGRADLALTVNLACQRIFSSRSCPAEKIGVVMNTPDDTIFPFRTPSISPIRAQGKPFVIMYHGSLVERNGLDLAIEAFARVRQVIPSAEFRIYGFETPFLEQVLHSVRSKGLDRAVRYLGQKRPEDIVKAIGECDVGVIPNHRSAFAEINTPTRIFEYLALGKPAIAPRARGVQDYFGEDALMFFELGNPEELAQRLVYVHSHPSEVMEIVKRGQRVYLAHTWRQESQTLVNLVGKLLNSGDRPD